MGWGVCIIRLSVLLSLSVSLSPCLSVSVSLSLSLSRSLTLALSLSRLILLLPRLCACAGVAENGQDKCGDFIEAHKACLRKEGFTVA